MIVSKFQDDVKVWIEECFGKEIAYDKAERNHRFLEEALELVQACECTAEEAHMLVDYVFNRPVGEMTQEVGGAIVTLNSLCNAHNVDLEECGDVELARIQQPEIMQKIKTKQATKPKASPLPQ